MDAHGRPISETEREERRRHRHEAHRHATYKAFIKDVAQSGHVNSDTAECAAIAVLDALKQRIVLAEGRQLEAQLPSELRDLLLQQEDRPMEVPRRIGREEFLTLVGDGLGTTPEETLPLVRAVLETVAKHISSGEVDQVVQQLPKDLVALWPDEVRDRAEAIHLEQAARIRAQTTEQPKPRSQPEHRAKSQALTQQLYALPLDAQLGFLRAVAPHILSRLSEDERMGFVRDLNEELSRLPPEPSMYP